MTIRWVKDVKTKKYHMLRKSVVRVVNHKAFHSTECDKVVEGSTFRDGFPPGADCTICLQVALQRGGSNATTVPTV